MFEHQLCIGNYVQEVTTPITVTLAAAVFCAAVLCVFGGRVNVSTEESHTCSAVRSLLGQSKGDYSLLECRPSWPGGRLEETRCNLEPAVTSPAGPRPAQPPRCFLQLG